VHACARARGRVRSREREELSTGGRGEGRGDKYAYTYTQSPWSSGAMRQKRDLLESLSEGEYLNLKISRVGVSQKYITSPSALNAIVFEHLK